MNKDYASFECRLVEMRDYNIITGTELELWEKDSDRQVASKLLADFGYRKSDILVAIGLTASSQLKQWPVVCYSEFINKLRYNNSKFKFVLLGNANERGGDILNNSDVLNLCGKITLRETVALLRNTVIYVGNDTGLMHIAVACGCAVVEVSSFSEDGDVSCGISSSRFYPWSKSAMIAQPVHQLDGCEGMCQMSYPHCITQVAVADVFDAAVKLLKMN